MIKFDKPAFGIGVNRALSGFYLRWLWWREGRDLRLFPKSGKLTDEAKAWAEDVIRNRKS